MPRALILSLLITITSCIGSKKSRIYTSRSPNGQAEVRIEESNCSFDNCAIRAILKYGPQSTVLWERGDGKLTFAHVAWSKDQVAVFIDGRYNTAIRSGYDFSRRQFINFAEAEPWFRQSITSSYSVTPEELAVNDGDVMKWAFYPREGNLRRCVQEFQKRLAAAHPQR